MRNLWNNIQFRNWNVTTKNAVFITTACLISAIIGFVSWCVVRLWTFDSLDWLICFILYPAIISIVITFIYIGKHNFR